MYKSDTKMNLIFFTYVLLMTVIFLSIFLGFTYIINQTFDTINADVGSIVALTPEESVQIYSNTDQYTIYSDQLTSSIDFQHRYTTELLKLIPLMLSLFFVLAFIAAFMFKRLMLNQTKKVETAWIEDLGRTLDNKKLNMINPSFSKIKQHLSAEYDRRLVDNQRLYSYLAHEQKNRIAILRSAIQMSGEKNLLPLADKLNIGIDEVTTLCEEPEFAEREQVDILLLCAELCDDYRPIHPQISLVFDEYSNDHFIVSAKERWIKCAIGNLIDNAVKYCPAGAIEVHILSQHNNIIVKVKDAGKGMDEEEQKNIFSYFYRLNELKKDGYGIGLALVSHVCELCNGFIFVESEKEKGSTFILSLPAACQFSPNHPCKHSVSS